MAKVLIENNKCPSVMAEQLEDGEIAEIVLSPNKNFVGRIVMRVDNWLLDFEINTLLDIDSFGNDFLLRPFEKGQKITLVQE